MSPEKARALIAQYQQMTGKTLKEITAQGAKIVAEVLAVQSVPMGKGADARNKGRGKVASDVRKLFPANPWNAIRQKSGTDKADEFWQVYQAWRGKSKRQRIASWQDVARVLDGSGVMPISGDLTQAHRNSRDKRGRVKRGVVYFAQSQRDVDKYSRELQNRVGYSKGGWAAAARQLGNSRLPAWMSGPGRGNVWSVGAKHEAKARNLVRWADYITPQDKKASGYTEAQRRVLKMMAMAIAAQKAKVGA